MFDNPSNWPLIKDFTIMLPEILTEIFEEYFREFEYYDAAPREKKDALNYVTCVQKIALLSKTCYTAVKLCKVFK